MLVEWIYLCVLFVKDEVCWTLLVVTLKLWITTHNLLLKFACYRRSLMEFSLSLKTLNYTHNCLMLMFMHLSTTPLMMKFYQFDFMNKWSICTTVCVILHSQIRFFKVQYRPLIVEYLLSDLQAPLDKRT